MRRSGRADNIIEYFLFIAISSIVALPVSIVWDGFGLSAVLVLAVVIPSGLIAIFLLRKVERVLGARKFVSIVSKDKDFGKILFVWEPHIWIFRVSIMYSLVYFVLYSVNTLCSSGYAFVAFCHNIEESQVGLAFFSAVGGLVLCRPALYTLLRNVKNNLIGVCTLLLFLVFFAIGNINHIVNSELYKLSFIDYLSVCAVITLILSIVLPRSRKRIQRGVSAPPEFMTLLKADRRN